MYMSVLQIYAIQCCKEDCSKRELLSVNQFFYRYEIFSFLQQRESVSFYILIRLRILSTPTSLKDGTNNIISLRSFTST